MNDENTQAAAEAAPADEYPVKFQSPEHGTHGVVRADGTPLQLSDIQQGRKVQVNFDAEKNVFISDVGLTRKHRRALKSLAKKDRL